MATTLARLVAELSRRRRERQDRRNRIRKLPSGRRRRALVLAQRRTIARAHDVRNAIMRLRRAGNQWGGSRAVTDTVIEFVESARPGVVVTSRKRAASDPLSIANPGSDHSGQNRLADAVDFALVEDHEMVDEIARFLGHRADVDDYEHFYVWFGAGTFWRRAKRFRIQLIASQHGTGPHLHLGVRRA